MSKRGHVVDAIWMSLSIALRLGAGTATFIVLARCFGASAYGAFMSAFALGALLAIPVNFGFTTFLLKELALHSDGASDRSIMGPVIGLKLILLLMVLGLSPVLAAFSGVDGTILFLLVSTHAADSFIEVYCVRVRVRGRFQSETLFMTKQASLQLLVVSAVAFATKSLVLVAAAYLFTRVTALALAFSLAAAIDGIRVKPVFSGIVQTVRSSWSYLVDMSAQTALVQMDVVILGQLGSARDVGIYQAAMRICQGLSQMISVLVNVVLPKVVSRFGRDNVPAPHVARLFLVFGAVGLVFAVPLFVFGTQLAEFLFGHDFREAGSVLQILAVFLVLRFTGAASGLLLIAMGDQAGRAVVMAGATILLVLMAVNTVPSGGATATATSVVAAYGFIVAAMGIRLFFRRRERRLSA